MDYKMLGKRISEERQKLRLTQQQLAEMTGLSLAFIGNIERGERKFSVETLYKVAFSLNISCDYLLDTQDYLQEIDISNELENLTDECTDEEKAIIVKIIKAVFPYKNSI